MNAGPELQLHPARGERVGDGPGIGNGTGQAVKFRYDQRVSGPDRRQCLIEPRPRSVRPGIAVVGEMRSGAIPIPARMPFCAVRSCLSVEHRA